MNRAFVRWCRAATRTLPFARQRREAAQELYGHLEDVYQALLDQGADPQTAQARALAAMGSAKEVRSALFWAHMSAKEGSSMLKQWQEQTKWTELYRGRDQAKYLKLRRALDKAEIKYQADEFDMLSRMQTQVGTSYAVGQSKRGGAWGYRQVNSDWIQMKQFGKEDANLYTLKVRGRDMAAARQAEYTLDQDLETGEPVIHQEADLSVLKAPLTQAAYKSREEVEHIDKVKGRLMDAGIILTILGLIPFILIVMNSGLSGFTAFFPTLAYELQNHEGLNGWMLLPVGGCICLVAGIGLFAAAGIYWWRKNR